MGYLDWKYDRLRELERLQLNSESQTRCIVLTVTQLGIFKKKCPKLYERFPESLRKFVDKKSRELDEKGNTAESWENQLLAAENWDMNEMFGPPDKPEQLPEYPTKWCNGREYRALLDDEEDPEYLWIYSGSSKATYRLQYDFERGWYWRSENFESVGGM